MPEDTGRRLTSLPLGMESPASEAALRHAGTQCAAREPDEATRGDPRPHRRLPDSGEERVPAPRTPTRTTTEASWERMSLNSELLQASPGSSQGGVTQLLEEMKEIVGPPPKCGHGRLRRLFLSHTTKNNRRLFWRWPMDRQGQCSTFQWCNRQPLRPDLDRLEEPTPPSTRRGTPSSSTTLQVPPLPRRCPHRNISRAGTNAFKIMEKCLDCNRTLVDEPTPLGLAKKAQKRQEQKDQKSLYLTRLTRHNIRELSIRKDTLSDLPGGHDQPRPGTFSSPAAVGSSSVGGNLGRRSLPGMIDAEESQLSGRKLKRLLRQGQGALAEAHQMWQNVMTCLQEPEGPTPFDQLLCTVANSKTPNCKFVHRLAKLLGPSTGKKQAKVVAEVYNPNRFSSRSEQHGLKAGEAFDLELGHDLTKETYRRTVREYLNRHKPGLVCIYHVFYVAELECGSSGVQPPQTT